MSPTPVVAKVGAGDTAVITEKAQEVVFSALMFCSHVGSHIGGGRFVHAPPSKGKVRTRSLREGWFAARFEEARICVD